ncbi:hypothetical protein [Saccharopolyspora sp. ASAGF58]|uniref:hypothetical protein n=1 Tax=Saccharopolyspora sp. ASAGF58 TaxID=2719023 RepID=UPI001FF0B8D3|nr:hypothetical protein [Saccharopolyspora sp. ASAGF58]
MALPQIAEQAANADRVDELGLGRRLDASTLTAHQLRTTVNYVAADEQVRANLGAMRQIVRDCGGAIAGADARPPRLKTRPQALPASRTATPFSG